MQKEKRHSSSLWKTFQISSNCLFFFFYFIGTLIFTDRWKDEGKRPSSNFLSWQLFLWQWHLAEIWWHFSLPENVNPYNFAFIYKVHSICLQIHADYVAFLFEKRFLRKQCKEHSIVCMSALMIINKIVLVVHWCYWLFTDG